MYYCNPSVVWCIVIPFVILWTLHHARFLLFKIYYSLSLFVLCSNLKVKTRLYDIISQNIQNFISVQKNSEFRTILCNSRAWVYQWLVGKTFMIDWLYKVDHFLRFMRINLKNKVSTHIAGRENSQSKFTTKTSSVNLSLPESFIYFCVVFHFFPSFNL